MGILFLTIKQERCSDLLLWSAAWLLPPPMLRLIPTTATATDMVLALPAMVVMVLATTARGLLRPSLRLMPSTDTELTPTPLPTATLPLPLPLLPSLPLSLPSPPLPLLPPPSLPLPLLLPLPLTLSLPPPSLPTLLPPLPLATLVLDTPVLATLVLAMELTLTARGPLMLSPRLMPTMPPTELTPTPDSATDTLDSATATALVLEPTELTELTTVNFAQQQKLNTVSTVSSPVMGVGHLVLSGERESCLV